MTTDTPNTTQPTQTEAAPHPFAGLAAFAQQAAEQLKLAEQAQQPPSPVQPAQD